MTAQNYHETYWRYPWSLRNALRDLVENFEEREARRKSRHHVQVALHVHSQEQHCRRPP
jgi:hypothetical protein